MTDRKIILGIDTSNYTTSLALLYDDGELIANIKKPLPVKTGERGLRQSDALFAHIKNIPLVMEEMRYCLGGRSIAAVGVSTRPRSVEGSYMPCFLAGLSIADSIGSALSVPVYSFSHQCGHIMAAIYSSGNDEFLSGKEFCAFHVSGGTTEMLKVKFNGKAFDTELVGGTADLNAGQAIDRIGVYIGLPFPAGPAMEMLALSNKEKITYKKPKIADMKVNLSGVENMAIKMFDATGNKELTSAFVLDYIASALELLADKYKEINGETNYLFAGGVMSNSIIKQRLNEKFSASFAEPAFSADNAVGIAALALRQLK